jgi:hypothetical protein
VLPGARRFRELGAAGGDELPPLAPLDRRTREAAAEGGALDGAPPAVT